MTNIAMLAVCLLVGMILRKTQRMPDNAHLSVNAFIIHVALPALILGRIHRLRLLPELLFPDVDVVDAMRAVVGNEVSSVMLSPVPEPTSKLLLGPGIFGLGLLRRRWR